MGPRIATGHLAGSGESGVRVAVVVPAFDEASRLASGRVLEVLADPDVTLVLVDDGSTDGTAAVMHNLSLRAPGRVRVLELPRNLGKAEAVRTGLREGIAAGAWAVGYLDADLAAPPSELLRLLEHLRARPERRAVLGARVALLGRDIRRSMLRHYTGRVFATAASLALGVAVYDTQCGAKVFRVDATLADALAEPFADRWAFDVELLARLLRGSAGALCWPADAIEEVPLLCWQDGGDSKVRLGAALRATLSLARLALRRRA